MCPFTPCRLTSGNVTSRRSRILPVSTVFKSDAGETRSRFKRASALPTALLLARLTKVHVALLLLALTDVFVDDANRSSPPAHPVGRFGVIAGEAYSSPRASRKKSTHAKLIKEPTDHSKCCAMLTFPVLMKSFSPLVRLK